VELRDALRRRPVTPERRIAVGAVVLQIEQFVSRGEEPLPRSRRSTRRPVTASRPTTSTITAAGPAVQSWSNESGDATADVIVDVAPAYRPIAL
jgi:hypothetical protein